MLLFARGFCLNQIFFFLTFVNQEEEGVSRVRVTSRRSPHKVERVSGLVTLSHVDVPKVSLFEEVYIALIRLLSVFDHL